MELGGIECRWCFGGVDVGNSVANKFSALYALTTRIFNANTSYRPHKRWAGGGGSIRFNFRFGHNSCKPSRLTRKWISNLVRVYVQMNKNVLKYRTHTPSRIRRQIDSNFGRILTLKLKRNPIEFYDPLFDCETAPLFFIIYEQHKMRKRRRSWHNKNLDLLTFFRHYEIRNDWNITICAAERIVCDDL